MLKSEKVSENISKRLRAAMKARGYTPFSLAEDVGITHTSIYGYLEGRRMPRADYMVAMAETLGVGLDWLVGRKGASKTGAWLQEEDASGEMFRCSECGAALRNWGRDKYCRECGAKMNVEANGK